MTFDLPYPPTVNTYWRRHGNRYFIAGPGKKFRKDAYFLIKTQQPQKLLNEVSVTILLSPPDRRRRDVDNVVKPVLDILQYAGVINDDSQVGELIVKRNGVVRGGATWVLVAARDGK